MSQLEIKNLTVSAVGQSNNILNDVSLNIDKGDILALLGPNGHGKSTLLNTIMGSTFYTVNDGDILLNKESILNDDVTTRSKKGIFMAFQNPPEIPGVITMDFLKASMNAHLDKPVSIYSFYKEVNAVYNKVNLDEDLINRYLNDGFSGGEKKRNEILQLLLLKPQICMLDEIDSGLDFDSIKMIADIINDLKKEGTTFIIISHYQKLLELVKPNKTAILVNGKVVLEGDYSLSLKVATSGYSFLEKEYHIDISKKEKKQVMLESCAVKKR